jgi:hypothetical protein
MKIREREACNASDLSFLLSESMAAVHPSSNAGRPHEDSTRIDWRIETIADYQNVKHRLL